MLYNIYFELAAIAYLIVLNLYIRIQYTAESPSNMYFRRLAVIMLLAVILDVTTAITISYYRFVPLWANMTLNTMYFFADIILEYYFIMYCLCASFGTVNKPLIPQIAKLFVISCIIFLFINIFTGWVFYFNENGYQHGPTYMIVHILPILVIIITSVMMLLNFSKFNKKQRISIISLCTASAPLSAR